MNPLLNLTSEERRWNDYYTTGGRRGVTTRRFGGRVRLDAQSTTGQVVMQSPRRSRVYSITWAGDVHAMRVRLYLATGEQLTVQPMHIPLLSGQGTYSPETLNPVFYPPYPSSAPSPPNPGAIAPELGPAWVFVIEPNVVLPGNMQLIAEYDLADQTSTATFPPAPRDFYEVSTIFHCYQFPGFENGP